MKWRSIVAAMVVFAVAGCGSSGPAPRPITHARLVILSPTPAQVTGPNVTLKFEVIDGTVLSPAQAGGPLRGDQGHIHVSLDGKLVQMAYKTTTELTGLSPGLHVLQAEWVASDHLPFRNDVKETVAFRVRGT